jgi:outer membrane protein assembly factor BamD
MKNLTLLLIAVFVLAGCGSMPTFDSSTPQGIYEYGAWLEKQERYEEALIQFRTVKNKHPYSSFATDAELKIADIHYTREAFLEAQLSYQAFKEFHPRHPQSAYVTYRLGMSIFNQLPSTVDRDLDASEDAIAYFDEVTDRFTSSKYSKDAAVKRKEVYQKLAEKIIYIADFYYKKEQWKSAYTRYLSLLAKYPNRGQDSKALFRAAFCADKMGEKLEAQRLSRQLQERFPNSSEAKRVRNLF